MDSFKRASGFTLIELITVIVMLGAMSYFALPRFKTSDTSLLTSRDMLVAACAHVQQLAMARDSSSNPVTLVVAANLIDVQENGSSVVLPGATYPFTFPNGISVTGGIGTLQYDKLGKTSATTISLNAGQVTVTIEDSGYAY